MTARHWLLGCIAAVALIACGHNGGNNGDGDGGTGSGGDGGSGSGTGDGGFSGGCTVGGPTECADCIDNDGDGRIDGFDPQCSGPRDDREDSFATGIPGDNIDATWQDCFFDGNSGAGNDGCNQHVCCLLQVSKADCMFKPQQYNQNECYMPFGNTPVPQQCIDVCAPLTTPGCDCFGCCTICQTASDPLSCRDIVIDAAVSPNCTQMNITDPGPDGVDGTGDEPCHRCVKNTMCGNTECGGATCVLCPGQDPSSLPPSCMGGTMCPADIVPCAADGSCPVNTYCSVGCCIGTIL